MIGLAGECLHRRWGGWEFDPGSGVLGCPTGHVAEVHGDGVEILRGAGFSESIAEDMAFPKSMGEGMEIIFSGRSP